MLRDRDIKSCSTSSILLSSTMNTPNVKLIIKAVATLIHSNLLDDMQDGKTISTKSDLYYFSENKYINENPQNFEEERVNLLRKTPTQEDIAGFIEALYDLAQFSPECCVICLIYIYRIIALTEMPLLPTNWRPLVLISLMIAQKMWDDKFLSNQDFSYIYPFFEIAQVNKLEMKFLELIQYNTHIKFSIYTKYYLELKSLVPEEFPLKPMDIFTMQKLENQSKGMEENLKKFGKTGDSKVSGQNSVHVIN